jgi:hypothetical protein
VKKYLSFLLVLFFLIVSVGSDSIAQRKRTKIKKTAPTPERPFACVDPITLSTTEVFIPCRIGYVPTVGCPDQTLINVGVKGNVTVEGEAHKIKYTVSGGRIIEGGEYVKWDLSDVKEAGIYLLTVDFLDGNNQKVTNFEAVSVRNCDCPNACVCPQRSVAASQESVKAGEIITFTAKTAGQLPSDVIYNWTISGGGIIEGQGTAEIKVQTFAEMAATDLTAAFEIVNYTGCPTCEQITSGTVPLIK